MKDAVIGGVAISANVCETIAGLAVHDLPGVVSVGKPSNSFWNFFGMSAPHPAIYATSKDNNSLIISVHITVADGVSVKELVYKIREVVSSAVYIQTGLCVSAVNVYIDGVEYAN